MKPGGALLFADVIKPRTEHARSYFAAAWEEEIRRRSMQTHGDKADDEAQ